MSHIACSQQYIMACFCIRSLSSAHASHIHIHVCMLSICSYITVQYCFNYLFQGNVEVQTKFNLRILEELQAGKTPNPSVETSRDPIDLTFVTPNPVHSDLSALVVTPSPVRHIQNTPNRTHDFVQSPTFSPRESPLFMVRCLFTQTVTICNCN